MTLTRALLGDDLRARMVGRVMQRDSVTESAAKQIVNGLTVADLTRLELEVRDRASPAFSADYDPYAR